MKHCLAGIWHEVVGSAPKTNVIVVAVRYRLSLQRSRPVSTTRALIKVDVRRQSRELRPAEADLPASNGYLGRVRSILRRIHEVFGGS